MCVCVHVCVCVCVHTQRERREGRRERENEREGREREILVSTLKRFLTSLVRRVRMEGSCFHAPFLTLLVDNRSSRCIQNLVENIS